MRKKGKNKGFTLIEVIIALAILAVALAPLMANFIVSSKMNLKSRKNLNAMNLAQDMMEGMRGYSASDLRGLLAAADSATIVGSVLPANTSYNQSTCLANETGAPNVYEYTIGRIVTAAGKGNNKTNTYDVKVEMTADTAVYDGKDMAAISSVDQYWNPVYTMSETVGDDEDTAVNAIYDKVKNNVTGKTADDLKKDMQREIRLKTSVTTNALGNKAYSTTVEVVYSIKSDKYGTWGISAGNVTDSVYQTTHNISKAAASDCPTAIYLYYTGFTYANNTYNTDPTKYNEVISITNQTEQDITVYLIRTQVESEITANDTYNDNYRCRVNLEAGKEDGSSLAAADPGWIYLVTNVRYHLSHGEEENKRNQDENGTAIALPSGVTSYYNRSRAIIYYNSTTNTIVESDYQQNVSDGYQKSDQGLLYKVKLTIMDSNTGDVVATYDGGTVN